MKFIRELKNKIDTILTNTGEILRLLKQVAQPKKESELLTVARHTLGSIDISDITDPDNLPEADYKEYVATAFGIHSMIQKELKWIMKLQHDFWFTQSDGWDQTLFGRGTTNGIQLIVDRFELLKNKHLENTKPIEEPELGSREDILAKLQVRSDIPSEETETGENNNQ